MWSIFSNVELLFSFLSKLVYKCANISNLPLQDPVMNFWVSNFYCVLFGVFFWERNKNNLKLTYIALFYLTTFWHVLPQKLVLTNVNSSFWAPSKWRPKTCQYEKLLTSFWAPYFLCVWYNSHQKITVLHKSKCIIMTDIHQIWPNQCLTYQVLRQCSYEIICGSNTSPLYKMSMYHVPVIIKTSCWQ